MTTESLTITLDGVNCPGCVAKIERSLDKLPGVMMVRGNATQRRMRLVWDGAKQSEQDLITTIEDLGYGAQPLRMNQAPPSEPSLMPHLGVAGFCMMNIMTISVAVWFGFGTDMGAGSMQFLHWISAILACPVVFYSSRAFYVPAFRAIKKRHMTMDTPISLAIFVTYAASMVETFYGGQHVYFDSVSALVFFLLIGRVIERSLKQRSNQAADNLANLMKIDAKRKNHDGSLEIVPAESLVVGDVIHVETGARVAADGTLLSDHGQIDESVITGETKPRELMKGNRIIAGAIVVQGPIEIAVTHLGDQAQIGKIIEMTQDAAEHKGKLQRLADQFSRTYIPLVFGGGLVGFLFWKFVLGADFSEALMISVAVLIVTCPCAAGLATPAVAARAVNLLMRHGVIVKSTDALERLSQVDAVIADKTGTLSDPVPVSFDINPRLTKQAASLAVGSHHPLARALSRGVTVDARASLREVPGLGVESGDGARLGSARFVGEQNLGDQPAIWFREVDGEVHRFDFFEQPLARLPEFLSQLQGLNLNLTLLSGDSEASVSRFATQNHIANWQAEARPEDKLRFVKDASAHTLMFGDGINDTPALSYAYTSVSYASASEVAQVAADVVLTKTDPSLLTTAIKAARQSRKLILQNLWFSAAYNIATLPLALMGILTPLTAAVLMSSSSIIVMVNGLRLSVAK